MSSGESPHRDREAAENIVEELKARQQNLVWPNALKNSRSVDEFLWRGAPDAPLVQRIGAWLFGSAFTLIGIIGLTMSYEKPSIAFGMLSLVCLYVGGRVFLNGFRRRGGKHRKIRR